MPPYPKPGTIEGELPNRLMSNKDKRKQSVAGAKKRKEKTGSIDNDKVQKEFAKIQKSLKSHGYQAKSVNDIYHDERSSYYFAVVDGGKRIVILEDSYGDLYSGYIERQDKD